MTLIKELIDIPREVHKGDYVLRLTEGIREAEKTLGEYVVTDQLVRCFDHALSFIRSAVEGRTSKASYLHGSYGSGKSHFMAVLHLILQGNKRARAIPELAGVIAKNNAWMEGKKFLMAPYHMIGAKSMESAILGGYTDHVMRLHPDAHMPGVYLAEKIFRDADALRERMGDDSFFQGLNEVGGNDAWGDLDGWSRERFQRAAAAPAEDDDRRQLVGDLVDAYFSAQREVAKSSGEGFITLDDGLSVMSKHARELGYGAVILFLDELVLWLSTHAANMDFVQREGQKLAKLVEAQTPDRPAPIVSLVARQRDLRDLVGKNAAGAAAMNFHDILGHWEGRFDVITLEDGNLPQIVEKRLLIPKNDAARARIDDAFDRTARVREEVMKTLLTREGDRGMFRQLYPFSPALVQALIALSNVLQRERTAIKVMLQLLVDHRETMTLGDVVPVGDLFDIIAHGEEAFNEEMRKQFDNAWRLYREKLTPLLEKQHGRAREELEKEPHDHPARTAFRNDDRLLKTLLLSALAPGVEALRGLTASRLAALNHGAIQSPIPGREGHLTSQRIKRWAAEIGEIKVGDEVNPSISLQLSGVDTESIIDQARREDNAGNRIRHIRSMLFAQLGIEDQDAFSLEHPFVWRGAPRACEVIYGNIRTLPDSALEPSGDHWKLIIDFPFDDPPHGPRDDISRLQKFKAARPEGVRSIAWVPSFFTPQAQKNLGLLVILEHILTGERYRQYSAHLSERDQASARALLENQRSMLRQRVLTHLCAAFGLDMGDDEAIDGAHELSDHFQSLDPGFEPRPPAAASLKGAMESLLHQAMARQFPAHPRFEAEIRPALLRKVHDVASRAARTRDGRIPVERALRAGVGRIADPLLLGEMGETHFVLGRHWKNHFDRKAAETGGEITVGRMREWMDQPEPMGLPEIAGSLVILVYAEQTNRSFFLHGEPREASLTSLRADMEAREGILPSQEAWEEAAARAETLFNVSASRLLNATNVSSLAHEVREKSKSMASACRNLGEHLKERLPKFGVEPEKADRWKTATASAALLERITRAPSDNDVVIALAEAGIATSQTAMGQAMEGAAALAARMSATVWKLFNETGRDSDAAIREIRKTVADALTEDEHVAKLGPALEKAQERAAAIQLPERVYPDPPPSREMVKRVVDRGKRGELDAAGVKKLLKELQGKLGEGRTLRINLSWIIEEERDK